MQKDTLERAMSSVVRFRDKIKFRKQHREERDVAALVDTNVSNTFLLLKREMFRQLEHTEIRGWCVALCWTEGGRVAETRLLQTEEWTLEQLRVEDGVVGGTIPETKRIVPHICSCHNSPPPFLLCKYL